MPRWFSPEHAAILAPWSPWADGMLMLAQTLQRCKAVQQSRGVDIALVPTGVCRTIHAGEGMLDDKRQGRNSVMKAVWRTTLPTTLAMQRGGSLRRHNKEQVFTAASTMARHGDCRIAIQGIVDDLRSGQPRIMKVFLAHPGLRY